MNNSDLKQVSSEIVPSSLIGFQEFISVTGSPAEVVQEILDLGWILPSRSATDQLLFSSVHIYRVSKLLRICKDFDIPTSAGTIIVDLLQRVDELEERVRELASKA
jgi:chaperone modulatory protein CbpM